MKWLPNKPRDIDEIADDVRTQIRKVVTDNAGWPLVFVGEQGSGKTCAALCVLDWMGGWYYTAGEWADRVQDAKMNRLQTSNGYPISAHELWRDLERTKLFVLDELGVRKTVSDHHYESVLRAVDTREGLPAIYLSNIPLSELATIYDARLSSRLSAGTIVRTHGDRRVRSE